LFTPANPVIVKAFWLTDPAGTASVTGVAPVLVAVTSPAATTPNGLFPFIRKYSVVDATAPPVCVNVTDAP
jgi:hypothetical protein